MSAAQFATFKKNQPEFEDYLWGRIENNNKYPELKKHRAIPIKTYNLGTEEESVTFELKNISEITNPGPFIFTTELIKLKSFILILFPLFYVLEKNYEGIGFLNPLAILFAAISSVLLFAGLNMRNDVYDHISGFDRVNPDSGKKPIGLGWISAQMASRVSLILIGVAAVVALPALLLQPKLVGIVSAAAGLFILGRFAKNNSYKQQHTGEIILFLLVGPVLVSGYQMATGSVIDSEVIYFGLLWGFAVFYLIQVNNFSHIMTSSQSGIKNTMTKIGFDWSQKFLFTAWILFVLMNLIFQVNYFGRGLALVSTVILIAVSVPTLRKILNIKSPMGSELQVIRKEVHGLFILMVLLFVINIILLKLDIQI